MRAEVLANLIGGFAPVREVVVEMPDGSALLTVTNATLDPITDMVIIQTATRT